MQLARESDPALAEAKARLTLLAMLRRVRNRIDRERMMEAWGAPDYASSNPARHTVRGQEQSWRATPSALF